MPPSYVPYKGIYVPYKRTFGTPDQGQMLDVQEGQTAESALRDDWTRMFHIILLKLFLKLLLKLFLNTCARDNDHDSFDPGSRSNGLFIPRN